MLQLRLGVVRDNAIVPGVHEDATTAMRLKAKKQGVDGGKPGPKTIAINHQTPLHRNCGQSWATLPPSFVRYILECCEPVSLSVANMKKAYVRKGCREPPKDVLHEIFEFVVDEDPQASFGEATTLG